MRLAVNFLRVFQVTFILEVNESLALLHSKFILGLFRDCTILFHDFLPYINDSQQGSLIHLSAFSVKWSHQKFIFQGSSSHYNASLYYFKAFTSQKFTEACVLTMSKSVKDDVMSFHSNYGYA